MADVYHRDMGYVLSKIIGTLLSPGVILLMGLSIGAALLWTRRRWRTGRALLSWTMVIVLFLVLTPIEPTLTETLENRFPANPTLPTHVDGIIVLGGAIDQYISQARHRVSLNDAAERIVAAVLLSKAYPEARVLFTGGSADPLRPEPAEAPLAGALLVALGVDADHLVIEDKSRNTYENAVFSQRLADPRPGQVWILVTSARHMPRAVGVFRHINWPVIPYPVDYLSGGGPEWANLDLPMLRLRLLAQALHEWIGLAFYRLSGWTDTLFPGP